MKGVGRYKDDAKALKVRKKNVADDYRIVVAVAVTALAHRRSAISTTVVPWFQV